MRSYRERCDVRYQTIHDKYTAKLYLGTHNVSSQVKVGHLASASAYIVALTNTWTTTMLKEHDFECVAPVNLQASLG